MHCDRLFKIAYVRTGPLLFSHWDTVVESRPVTHRPMPSQSGRPQFEIRTVSKREQRATVGCGWLQRKHSITSSAQSSSECGMVRAVHWFDETTDPLRQLNYPPDGQRPNGIAARPLVCPGQYDEGQCPFRTAPKPRDDGAWRRRHDEGSSVTAIQLGPDAGEQLNALGHDNHPNVGNLIGYSYRPSRRRALLNVSSRRGDK
jgi:hypothetical protein